MAIKLEFYSFTDVKSVKKFVLKAQKYWPYSYKNLQIDKNP